MLAVRQFFGWAVAQGHFSQDPCARTVVRRVPGCTPAFTVETMEALLATPDAGTRFGLRDRAILATLYRAALKPGESQGLDLGDVDFEHGVLAVRGAGGVRYPPVDEALASALQRYLEEGRPGLCRCGAEKALFLSEWGRRLCPRGITRIVREHGLRMGLQVQAYQLRLAQAQHQLEGGATVAEIQVMLGYTDATRRNLERRREGNA